MISLAGGISRPPSALAVPRRPLTSSETASILAQGPRMDRHNARAETTISGETAKTPSILQFRLDKWPPELVKIILRRAVRLCATIGARFRPRGRIWRRTRDRGKLRLGRKVFRVPCLGRRGVRLPGGVVKDVRIIWKLGERDCSPPFSLSCPAAQLMLSISVCRFQTRADCR
jgi:hypothetical protein